MPRSVFCSRCVLPLQTAARQVYMETTCYMIFIKMETMFAFYSAVRHVAFRMRRTDVYSAAAAIEISFFVVK